MTDQKHIDESVVVGLDPSLNSFGVCRLDHTGRLKTTTFGEKPDGVDVSDRMRRYGKIVQKVVEFIEADVPKIIVIEGYAFPRAKMSSIGAMVEIGGITRWELCARYEVIEVTPAQLKQFATGSGKADKHKVRMEIFKRYGLEFDTGDEADAFAVAKMGQAMIDEWAYRKLVGFQRLVIDKFRVSK